MATWKQFLERAPEMATFGAARLAHTGVAYLATIRQDGSPRVHPVSPELADDGRLYLFMEPSSPKRRDLLHDERYAMHSAVEGPDGGEGEFFLRGRARPIEDPDVRRAVASETTPDRYVLFELGVSYAMSTVYRDHKPVRSRWSE